MARMAIIQIKTITRLRMKVSKKDREDRKGIEKIVQMRAMNNMMMMRAAMSQVEKEGRKRRKN